MPVATPRVVGGSASNAYEYPFFATLLDTSRGPTVRDQHFCGGALISPFWVLTVRSTTH